MIGRNQKSIHGFKLFAHIWHPICTNSRKMPLMNILRTGSILLLALAISASAIGQVHEENHASAQELLKNTQVFPNPSVDYLHIKFENPIAKTVKLVVHSIIGNQIELESEIVDEYEVRLKVKELNTGYYIVAVHDQANNAKGTIKFLKR